MTIHSLRDVIDAVPSEPFTTRLADGRSAEAPHPDFILVTGGGRTASRASQFEDHLTTVDLWLVTQLDVGAAASANH